MDNLWNFWSSCVPLINNARFVGNHSMNNSYHVRFNVCPIAVKTDVRQIDLVLRLSDGTSEKIRNSQTWRYDRHIYFHWYKILGLYKRVLFHLQFVHNLFWLKLKWYPRSKLFYWYHLSFIHALMKFKDID